VCIIFILYISKRKEEQMACPLDATTGFLQITGPITPSQLKPIEVNTAPLTFQFAPRAVPPTLVGNVIEENSQNTLLYKSIRYELADVQITSPTHQGYNSIASFLGPPHFEVNLTFFSNQAPVTYPSILLLVVPVYTAQEQYHTGYFRQLLDTDVPAMSIQSLFFDSPGDIMAKSFSYQTCLDFVGEQPQSLQARVFVFPFGASIPQQAATALENAASAASGGVLPPYRLEKGILGGFATVLQYQVNDEGVKVPTQTSNEGFVATTPLSPVTDQFRNLLQYYTKPPTLSGSKTEEQCGLPTQDYKCVPFDPNSDLSGNLVVMGQGQTLRQLLDKQQSQKDQTLFPKSAGAAFWVLLIIAILPISLILVWVLLYGLSKGFRAFLYWIQPPIAAPIAPSAP
jgi:hypothetical protein